MKVLIAEDEKALRDLVTDYLEMEGYEVLQASNGKEAVDLYYKNDDISLFILDIGMPLLNGFETAKQIRKTSEIPIIFLTAYSQEEDQIKGFESGANDYVTKPFLPRVLMARVKANIKAEASKDIVTKGIIKMNISSRKVEISGEHVDLSPKEFELLETLIRNEGIALSRDNLLDTVWGYDYYGGLRTVDTHIKRLRSKMGGAACYVVTVRGYGYRFEVI